MGTISTGAPRGAHLVGSVPLADAEAVLRQVAASLGGKIRRIPDGETGERSNFIGFQAGVLAAHPAFVPAQSEAHQGLALTQYVLADGVDPDAIAIDDLGYAAAAAQSYETFARLKREGVLPQGVRFQVTLPTPRNVVQGFVAPSSWSAAEPVYERVLLAELERILASVPHDQLAIQVDSVFEVGVWDGAFPFPEGREGALARLLVLARAVPADVQLGFHLCYGDHQHEHFAQPRDLGVLVQLAEAILAQLGRPVHWIHMPVPRERDDDAYFAPLAALELPAETELYLGLVHHTDGVAGSRRRLAVARRVREDFGIATECGFGRRPVEQVGELLRIHAELLA
jgi:hypothetical protein